MKKAKIFKGIAVFLSAAISLNIINGAVRIAKVRYMDREPTVTEKTLRFNEEGKFKILQISDLQDCVLFRDMSKDFLNYLLDTEKPDLVVLTGDNIGPGTSKTGDLMYLTIHEFMSIFEEKGVKVASVFGNHDGEDNAYGKDEQIELYKRYSCYVGSDTPELSGSGTYNLPVLSSKSDKTVFNLWFFDSGERNDENDLGGYGCVHKDQIEWYVETEKALTKENGGAPVPSLAFQHIIIPEVFDVLTKVDNPEDKQYEGEFLADRNGEYYAFPEEYANEDT
ncbi:MAG: metallophosphoesterase, partial [Clostridia bacterium]|nr:metallophosphoesterase [Clostridia bacterium]